VWRPPVVVAQLMLVSGLLFLVRWKALAQVYVQRVTALSPEHSQYRSTPFATPGLLAAVGVPGVVGGIGAILLDGEATKKVTGRYTGTAVAAVALVCEVVVLLRPAGAADRTARAVTASRCAPVTNPAYDPCGSVSGAEGTSARNPVWCMPVFPVR
jgi:hypothetical protein